jgi:hypothetical protein
MKDPTSKLRSATRRAKSDVANKLISMFLHELSRKVCRNWSVKVESEAYATIVRDTFLNHCPYCDCDLSLTTSIVEHLDGMNRYRVGLHVPGNVLIACRRCNSEKRRDDSKLLLTLAETGWESFLSHDGSRCTGPCATCRYWIELFEEPTHRAAHLAERLSALQAFRRRFEEFQELRESLSVALPGLLTKLYADCQIFAEKEIRAMLDQF